MRGKFFPFSGFSKSAYRRTCEIYSWHESGGILLGGNTGPNTGGGEEKGAGR